MLRHFVAFLCLCGLASSSLAACHAKTLETFAPFFIRFAADKDFATQRTRYPLPVSRLVTGGEQLQKRTEMRSKAQDAGIIVLDDAARNNGLVQKQVEQTSSSAVMQVFKPDTDWRVDYHFVLQGNCWYLQKIEDASL